MAQNIAEKAYLVVVNDGPSTGPEFVVVTIVNSNTSESKEMILSINQLFDCLKQELNEDDSKKIKKYLLSKSLERIINLKNQEALKLVNFEKYDVERASKLEIKINNLITINHLIDSLVKIDTLERKKDKVVEDYEILRKAILHKISDSLSIIKPLNKKEKSILNSLVNPYYDGHEDECDKLLGDSKADSNSRVEILKIWDSKKELYKNAGDKCALIYEESARFEKKFFRAYYKKYGMIFCQVLFKYGAICYFGDENPIVGFEEVIK
jgi:hypothetical protein